MAWRIRRWRTDHVTALPGSVGTHCARWTFAAGSLALLAAGGGLPLRTPSAPVVIPLDGTRGLTLIGTHARAVSYAGHKAVELTEAPSSADTVVGLEEVALLDQLEFGDGTIELWVAGTLAPGADASARGFIGLVFRSSADGSHFENFYLRPTNGRADDQLRRNHSTQYASLPDYRGSGCGRRRLASTSRMPISCPGSGRIARGREGGAGESLRQ